jgi:outer membrane protein TolC
MLLAALQNRNLAFGQQVGASGAFDTKLKGASENGALGFYQTYRQSIGLVQPTYWGGEVFGGYRIGRGDYQPWYQERQTNDGGEFKAGVQVPLARNRNIDDRRAELWKAGLERQLAEPDIQAQLISAVQDGSYAWWDWVAAGEYHRIAVRILALAEERTSRIKSQVDVGFLDPPELTDNLRLVAIRQAKVADTRRKLQQTAAKLSIFLRDESGNPVLPREDQLPGFPAVPGIDTFSIEVDTQRALERRPELRMLDLLSRQIRIDLSNASNQLQPELNAVLWGSQDVGERTSKKGDKSPLEAEASVFLDVPVERRKARGKITESQAKLAQLAAKRRLTADKITVDVQMAWAAIVSAYEQVSETQAALKFAEELAERERQNLEAGASDLLKVTLREQYAVESAEKQIDALKLFHEALADYRAAIAQDQLNQQAAP